MRGEKKSLARAISFFITAFVILLLVFSGPAEAFSISLDIPDTSTEKGGINVFTGEVNIQSGENLPIEYLELQLDGPESVNCKFNVNGSIISGCKGIAIQQISTTGYGYGYGYGEYGYGYSFGYGYGYTQGKLKYEFTLNTSDYATGDYDTGLNVIVDGKTFSESGDAITISEPPVGFDLIIFSPNETIYNTRRIQFNLTATEEAEKIEYTNWNDKRIRWKLLCRDCDEYGYVRKRTKTLNEGENNLTFRATKNPIAEKNISLFIDSKKPKIYDTKPRSGFTNGLFSVEYREENPKELWLVYGNETDTRYGKVNLSECWEERRNTVCNITVDLTEFDEQEITYFCNMTDIADNYDESRERKVKVDFTAPRINNLTIEIDKRRVTFTLNISEKNFDEIVYIDDDEKKKERRLCSSLKDGICKKTRSFDEGNHTITIIARDEAGNENTENVSFFIDSKRPRIYDTEPSRGFVSGAFAVEYKEENPEELWLILRNETDIRSEEVNLGSCYEKGIQMRCDMWVNLTEFDEQTLMYKFNITDIAGNYDESREKEIMADFSKPRVDYFDFIQNRRKVTFMLNITEPNFKRASYMDNAEEREIWSLLCSRLENGYCENIKWFSRGEHNLTIEILDDAGNRETIEEVLFSV